jgi:hypothetical protein
VGSGTKMGEYIFDFYLRDSNGNGDNSIDTLQYILDKYQGSKGFL